MWKIIASLLKQRSSYALSPQSFFYFLIKKCLHIYVYIVPLSLLFPQILSTALKVVLFWFLTFDSLIVTETQHLKSTCNCFFVKVPLLSQNSFFFYREIVKQNKKNLHKRMWNSTTQNKLYKMSPFFAQTVAQLVIHSFVTPLELFWVAPSCVMCIQLWNDSVHQSHSHPHTHANRDNACRWVRFSLFSSLIFFEQLVRFTSCTQE